MEELKNIRKPNKNLTLKEISKKSGLSQSFLCRLEKGDYDKEDLSLKTLRKLAKGYSIKLNDLIWEV